MRVGDIAVGRSGDKGAALDLTVVARDDAGYRIIEALLTQERASKELPGRCQEP